MGECDIVSNKFLAAMSSSRSDDVTESVRPFVGSKKLKTFKTLITHSR